MLRYSIYGVVSFDLRIKIDFFFFLRYGLFSHSGSLMVSKIENVQAHYSMRNESCYYCSPGSL